MCTHTFAIELIKIIISIPATKQNENKLGFVGCFCMYLYVWFINGSCRNLFLTILLLRKWRIWTCWFKNRTNYVRLMPCHIFKLLCCISRLMRFEIFFPPLSFYSWEITMFDMQRREKDMKFFWNRLGILLAALQFNEYWVKPRQLLLSQC